MLPYFRDAVDKDGDGDISKEEFVKNAMQSKFIFNMLRGWKEEAFKITKMLCTTFSSHAVLDFPANMFTIFVILTD